MGEMELEVPDDESAAYQWVVITGIGDRVLETKATVPAIRIAGRVAFFVIF